MIHESAIIDPTAVIGKNVTVGPWTIIGPDVVVGDDCNIGPHVVLKGPTIPVSYTHLTLPTILLV